MAETTTIEWTEATWQIVTGCSIATPGCTNCYAMRLAGSRLQHHPSRVGLTRDSKAGPVSTGEVRFNREWLTQPLKWRRPRKIFVAAHGDLFHEGVPEDVLDRVFAVMGLAEQHTYQVLTKRAARMRAYLTDPRTPVRIVHASRGLDPDRDLNHQQFERTNWPLRNVWLGVSVEDQRRADERIPDLLATPAAVRWISAEPLLGPVNLHEYLLGFSAGHPASCACGHGHGFTRCPNYGRVSKSCHRCSCTEFRKAPGSDGLSWVVVGGESGPGARPMHPDWARSLRDQCAAAGVPYLFKQWGAYQHGSTLGARASLDRIVFNDGAMLTDCSTAACKTEERERGWHQRKPEAMALVGKKAAGRLLDGVEHNGFPGGAG